MKLIKRIIYYKDLRLLLPIFIKLLQIYALCLFKKDNLLLSSIPKRNHKSSINIDKQKIIRYADFCILLFRKIGIYDTCLTRSLIYCYALRQNGFDVSINFGAKKTQDMFIGHCWLKQDQIPEDKIDCKLIFSSP